MNIPPDLVSGSSTFLLIPSISLHQERRIIIVSMPATGFQTELSDKGVVKALAEVNSAAEIWSSAVARDSGGDDTTGEVSRARSQLTHKVSNLYSTIKGPADMIHDHLEKVCQTNTCIRADPAHCIRFLN